MDLKRQKGAFITLLVVLMILLFYAAGAFAAYNIVTDPNIRDHDDDERWDRPHEYVSDVSPSQYLSVEDLYLPKRFAPGEYKLDFSDSGEYFYHFAGGPDFQGGTWTFGKMDGTIIDEHLEEACDEGCLGFCGGGGFELDGGTLALNISSDGLAFMFLDNAIADDFMDESQFSVNFTDDVFSFNVPFELTRDTSGTQRLSARIDKTEGEFSALFYDDNFHLLAEVNNVSGTDIQIPSGGSDPVFVVLMAQGGGDFNVEFYFTPASVSGMPLILLVIAIFIAIMFVAKKLDELLKKSKE
jgi:hypothetical protein